MPTKDLKNVARVEKISQIQNMTLMLKIAVAVGFGLVLLALL